VQGVYKGTVKRTGPIPDNIQGYDPEAFVFTTDLEQARTLLTAGGYGEGSTISMSIEAESERSRTMAELFQANLAQIGVTLDIQVVDTTTQEDIVYGDAPAEEKPDIIGLWAWWPDYNDGWNQLAPNFLIEAAGGGGSNAGYYDNSSVADMMAQAEVSTSLEELDSLMKQIQQILIHDDPAAIFVGQVLYTTVADATIQGIEINPIYIEQYMFHRYYRSQG
ncbi:MAG: ABC transporter substrate-binding protein, partial [Chloroflexota bacterium]|nr:ABC transporter substrate-binding protein [Chloroflexota bacterium]